MYPRLKPLYIFIYIYIYIMSYGEIHIQGKNYDFYNSWEREREMKKNWKGKGAINEVKKAKVVAPNAVFRVARELKKKKRKEISYGIMISNYDFELVK